MAQCQCVSKKSGLRCRGDAFHLYVCKWCEDEHCNDAYDWSRGSGEAFVSQYTDQQYKDINASADSITQKATKLRVDLVPPEAIEGIARALQFGATKHGERKWETEPMKRSMVIAALLRHLIAYKKGEDIDPEMGIAHADAIAANAAILATYVARGIGEDDHK